MTGVAEVHPDPARAAEMPYAPAIEVTEVENLLFISGCTPSPLYHQHPHVPEEHIIPDDIREQTRRALESVKLVLDAKGLTWKHVVKCTKYLTDMREADGMHEVYREYFGDHRPASTIVEISALTVEGIEIEIEAIAAIPN